MWGRKHWQLILIFNTSFLLKRGRAGIHTVPTKPGWEHPSCLTELTPTEQQGLRGISSHRMHTLESWALSSSLHPLVPASVTLTNIMTNNKPGKEKFLLSYRLQSVFERSWGRDSIKDGARSRKHCERPLNGLFSALQAFLYTPAPLTWEQQHPQWAGLSLHQYRGTSRKKKNSGHICDIFSRLDYLRGEDPSSTWAL